MDEILHGFEDKDEDAYNESLFQLNHDTVFELVEPGILIGLRSASNALEDF